MRDDASGRRKGAVLGQVLPGGDAVYPVRRGSGLPLSLGDYSAATEDVRILGDAGVHRDRAGRVLVHLEKRRAGLGNWRHLTPAREIRARRGPRREESTLMELAPAVTDLEQLKGHPAIARLISWNPKAVEGVKFDRDEMTIYVERSAIREACALLRDGTNCPFNYLADITCVDWYPSEPRFEVIYHLLSIPNKERVRLKVRLSGETPA